MYKYSRSALTAPNFVKVSESKIRDAGLGVFATKPLPANILLGEYTGEIVSVEDVETREQNDAYLFTVRGKSGKPMHYISAKNARARSSNWTRFVNAVRNPEDKHRNCEFFQYAKRIWLKTRSEIPAGEELLVYYGDSYDLP